MARRPSARPSRHDLCAEDQFGQPHTSTVALTGGLARLPMALALLGALSVSRAGSPPAIGPESEPVLSAVSSAQHPFTIQLRAWKTSLERADLRTLVRVVANAAVAPNLIALCALGNAFVLEAILGFRTRAAAAHDTGAPTRAPTRTSWRSGHRRARAARKENGASETNQ
jgi:hypothetical protein